MTPDPDDTVPEPPQQDLLDGVTEPDSPDDAAAKIEEFGEPFIGNNA